MIALISSGMLRVFDPQAPQSRSLVIAIGFLVGYFSDSAAAKLSEIAETLFGASRAKEKHKTKQPNNLERVQSEEDKPNSHREHDDSLTT